ncbi:MAG: metallophosphoesterase [Pseudomonadales bacterium]
MNRYGLLILLIAGSTLSTPVLGAATVTAERIEKIVAFGDVHGAADALRSLLRSLDLIDSDDHWTGGATHLVSLGDLLDRGPESRQVMDLLIALGAQAPMSGGRIHVVLGNHEIMNLTGDMRYVAAEEFAAFASDESAADRSEAFAGYQIEHPDETNPESAFNNRFPPGFFGHRHAFSDSGRYGQWLLSLPQVLVLNDTAFVHGGLSENFTEGFVNFDEYNQRVRTEIDSVMRIGGKLIARGVLPRWQDPLTSEPVKADAVLPETLLKLRESVTFNDSGPSWYRGTAACHPLIERPRFERTLHALALKRVVMGHTPTFPRYVQTRFDGRAVLADTGMLASHYKGRPSAVIIENGGITAWLLNSAGELEERLGATPTDLRTGDEAEFTTALRKALEQLPDDSINNLQPGHALSLSLSGRSYSATFIAGSKQAQKLQLAAYHLDKSLGLGLVPVIIPYPANGKRGNLEVMPVNTITERRRIADNVYRPNWCTGISDYQLMYTFDMLIGNEARNGDNIHYDRATWLMYLNGHESAFPTTSRRPEYLRETETRIPAGLHSRLASLDLDALEQTLGEFLGKRQIRAIDQRRQQILDSWPVEN